METFINWCQQNKRYDLLDEFDLAKNANIDLETLSAGSGKKVWWLKHYNDPRTGKDFDFEWEATVISRTYYNSRCPYLINYKIKKGFNDLASLHPELIDEWNVDKNLPLSPEEIGEGSGKLIWWIKHYKDPRTGKEFDFEWKSTITDKLRYGCPFLSTPPRKIYPGFNDFLTFSPELEQEWDYEKNEQLNPRDYSAGSSKSVWWKCKNGHSYKSPIRSKTNGHQCPICLGQKPIAGVDDLLTVNPPFLKEWDYEKNIGIDPKDYKLHSNKSIWWKCEMGHSWKTTIAHRTEGSRCPYCYKEYGTSFAEQAILYNVEKYFECFSRYKINGQEVDIYIPELQIGFEYDGMAFHSSTKSAQREMIKDSILKEQGIVLYRIKESSKNLFDEDENILYVIPDRKYEYLTSVIEKIYEILKIKDQVDFDYARDSLIIFGKYMSEIKKNNISITHPELLKEWDYKKNGNVKPEYFLPGSQKKVWWICKKCGSSYLTDISHKVSGTKCPYCSGKKVNNTNSLESKYPSIASFWDYRKNREKPSEVYYSSKKKVWWICENCNNSYQMSLCKRVTAKTNLCPKCYSKQTGYKNRLKSISRSGSVADNPTLIIDWDYSKNTVDPKNIPQTSGDYAYWKCNRCGYEWKAKIINRRHGTGCPICRNKEAHAKHGKHVLQYDMKGNLIAEYSSLREAILKTGNKSISNCVREKCKSSKGYVFKYK